MKFFDWLSTLNDEYKVIEIKQMILEETRDSNDYELHLVYKKTGLKISYFYSGRLNFWVKTSRSGLSILPTDCLNYYLYKYKRIMKVKKYKVESGSNHFSEIF